MPQICHKQYKQASEMEAHLSSYDHHHRKRLAETKAMLSDRWVGPACWLRAAGRALG